MRKITIILLLLVASVANAQDSTLTRDLETWTSVGGQKKLLDKKLNLSGQLQFRLDDNTSRLYQYFVNIGGDYEIVKGLKLGAGYRFIKDGNKTKGFDTEHRFNVDLGYGHKVDRLKLNYRLRYQSRSNSAVANSPTSKYRLRLKADYNIKKWKYDPFFATEFFYANETETINYVEEITEVNAVKGMQKYRLQVGTKFKTGKVGTFKIYYMLEHQFANYGTSYGIPVNWNIIGLNYTFKL